MAAQSNTHEHCTWPLTGRFLSGRRRDELSRADKDQLESMVETVEVLESSTRMLERAKVYAHSTVLIEGFALRALDGPDGRHGVSFHVPGDFIDLHCFALKRLDHNIDTIERARLGYIPHDRIRQVMEERPGLARMLWFSTLLDAAMHREWIMKLGQLTPPRRIAHVFAEIARRLEMVDLAHRTGFETPLTQSVLADMVGASSIHVNRALAQLRAENIATLERGRVSFADRTRLEEYGEFDGAYLYGKGALNPDAV